MPDETMERTSVAVVSRKSPIVTIDPQAPSSPEVRALLKDVENKLKLSFTIAAAGVAAPEATEIDQLFQAMVAARPAAVRGRMQARAQSMLGAPAGVRETFFGRYGAVEKANYRGSDEAEAGLGRLNVSGQKLHASLLAFGRNDAVLTDAPPNVFHAKKLTAIDLSKLRDLPKLNPDAVAGAKYKKLGLFLNSVHCIEETSELSDSDEIAMGGVATDPDGDTHKIPEFMVSNDFDAGEKKKYPGRGKLLHEWSLVRGPDWPYLYHAVLCMAEKDGGGFADFITKLWKKIGDEVQKAIAGAVGSAIGAALGSYFGPLGTALGAAVGWLLGMLVDWIISWFEDDIIRCRTILLGLGAATKSYYDWAGLTADPPNQFSMNFNGDGGRYRVWCSLSVYP